MSFSINQRRDTNPSPTIRPIKKWILLSIPLQALLLGGGFYFYTSQLNTNSPLNTHIPMLPLLNRKNAEQKNIPCNPNDPKVTENVTLKGAYPLTKITQGSHTFSVITADYDHADTWLNESPWEVCGLPAIFLQNLRDKTKPQAIIWNGNKYEVPVGSEPLSLVHSQIAYSDNSSDEKTVGRPKHIVIADFPSTENSSSDNRATIQMVYDATLQGQKAYSQNVVYRGQTFGPYVKVMPSIIFVNGEPTYFASQNGQDYSVYKAGKIVSPPGITTSSPREKTLVNYREQPAYILTHFNFNTYTIENTLYIGSEPQSKQTGSPIALLVIGDTLAVNALVNGQPHIFLDGKDIGSGSSMHDTVGTIGFLSTTISDHTNNINIMRGIEKLGEIKDSNTCTFYPSRDLGDWGDFTFMGDTPVHVHRCGYYKQGKHGYAEQYVQYGNEKIFLDYSIKFVANINGKLVLQGSKDARMDYIFIEE